MPNPCLSETSEKDQYYPFAFSSSAFIQCNGELLYVQPCAAGSIWNQDLKVCDRPETSDTIAADQPASYEITPNAAAASPSFARPTANFDQAALIKKESYSTVTVPTVPIEIIQEKPYVISIYFDWYHIIIIDFLGKRMLQQRVLTHTRRHRHPNMLRTFSHRK
jgi:hypothetical protein